MEKNYVLKISALAFSALSFIFMIVGLTGSKLQTATLSVSSYGEVIKANIEYSARGELKFPPEADFGTLNIFDDKDLDPDACPSSTECWAARGLAAGGIAFIALGLLLHCILSFSFVKAAFEKFPICSCMGSGKTVTCLGIVNALLYLLGVILAFLAFPKLTDEVEKLLKDGFTGLTVEDPEIVDGGYLLIIGFVFSVIPLFLTCFVSKAGSSAETTATATAV